MIVIYNPAAGRRRANRLWRVLDVLVGNGVRVELAETRHPGHARCLAREACDAGARLVVAAGGDGTIAEVASGLFGGRTRLGVIPLGTANVLAQELGLPVSPQAVAAALAFGRTCALWPGVAHGGQGTRLFVQMIGVGLDAQVVHNLPLGLKRAIGRHAYVWQTLRETARYDFAPLRLRLDGVDCEAASAIVSKGRLYAGRYLLAPEARPCEPGFSVALFRKGGTGAALMYGAALPLGWLAKAPGVELRRASSVEVIGNKPMPAQSDGDPAGFTPLSIADASEPIRVVIG